LETSVNDEKMAPVSFRAAKPVDPKTRHPFSGEVLDAGVPVAQAVRQPDGFWRPEEPEPGSLGPQAAGPYGVVLADLRAKRDALNVAIAAIEDLR
jgi:hypothetical protein